MRWAIEWNPVTVKRWRRFRRLRRAWWSLWILTILYAISLASELVCNNTPLFIRFNDQTYFPVFRFHPEDTFLHNGCQTRPDYKQLAQSPAFAANPQNGMVFPLIPFGPNETTDPASIQQVGAITLAFRPESPIATVTLSTNLTIVRATGTEFFFGLVPESLQGQSLTNTWPLPASLQTAMESRWQNRASPSTSVPVISLRQNQKAELSLSEFIPRTRPPSTLRLTFREITSQSLKPGVVSLDIRLNITDSTFPLWDTLPPDSRSNLIAFAARRLAGPTEDKTLTINNTLYSITATKPEVRWPFPPTPGHWMGLDSAGRDVLARILYGLRTSMTFGFLLVALAMALGTLFGALQGYFGKTTDIVGQRFTEIWSAVPFLYVMILLGAVYGRGFMLLLICYAIFNWIGISYYIRAEFLRLRHLPFVEAARALGLPHRAIIFRHILPNALVPLITFFPFYLVGAIGALTALDYLGFGLPPPTPSWGELLYQAQQFRWAWWLILYPAFALFIVMLLGVFVGEGIREAYDPRPKTKFE